MAAEASRSFAFMGLLFYWVRLFNEISQAIQPILSVYIKDGAHITGSSQLRADWQLGGCLNAMLGSHNTPIHFREQTEAHQYRTAKA